MPIIDRIDQQTVPEALLGPLMTSAGNAAGTMPTLRRCTGACCRAFDLGALSLSAFRENLRRKKAKGPWPQRVGAAMFGYRVLYGPVPDIETIVEMLVPLGRHKRIPGRMEGYELRTEKPRPMFTCRFFTGTSCLIYDRRPHFCRDYPNGRLCGYRGCTREAPGKSAPEKLEKIAVEYVGEKESVCGS
jgi:Fe-S-cluster containining protein